MIKAKVSELSEAALDWAVARAEGWEPLERLSKLGPLKLHKDVVSTDFRIENRIFVGPVLNYQDGSKRFAPSTEWGQGGPLMEKHGIEVVRDDRFSDSPGGWTSVSEWSGGEIIEWGVNGPTFLIAVCRAIVSAKIGGEVEVPDELLKQ